MAEPEDMIVPLLREIRARMDARFDQNAEAHQRTQQRLDKMEAQLASFRQALTADTLLSKLVNGEFEERIEAMEGLERRVALLKRKIRELEDTK